MEASVNKNQGPILCTITLAFIHLPLLGHKPAQLGRNTWAGESHSSISSPKSSSNSSIFFGGIKRLAEKEWQDKKAKGLCYRCDDKWSLGHRCRVKEMNVVLVDDDEDAKRTSAAVSHLLRPPTRCQQRYP